MEMKLVSNLLLSIMLILLGATPVLAQEDNSTDSVSVDSIDRYAEDYITTSICIADPTDWRNDFMGILGHAFIRLQCPTFGIDYCFSYESGDANKEMESFLKGQLTMGMYRMVTDEYLRPFGKWKCGIHEYTLNLPPETELRLWEIMDGKVDEGVELDFDLMSRGCAQTLVLFIEQALNGTPINYGEWPEEFNNTRRKIIENKLKPYPWIRLSLTELLLDDDFNENYINERKILYPQQIADVWSKATLEGKPMLVYKEDLVKADLPVVETSWFTPMVFAILLLLITLAFAFTKFNYTDLAILALQFAVGLVLCWLVLVSNLPGSKGAHLLLLYNPLPLLLWHWRKYWALPYAGILLAWIIAMNIMPRVYVETPHFIFATTIIIILIKPMLRNKLLQKK